MFPGKRKKYAGNVSEGAGGPAPWKGNVRGPSAAFSHKAKKAHSWVDEARAASDPLLVEGVFRTGTQQHTCLEPHVAIARFDGDQLTLHVSTQAVFHLKELVAKRFKLDVAKIRVIAEHVGGGFGSKAVARQRDDCRDRACARGEGAGARRLRPARGTDRHRLSARCGDEASRCCRRRTAR